MKMMKINELPRSKAKTKKQVELRSISTNATLERKLDKFLKFMAKETNKRYKNKVMNKIGKKAVNDFTDSSYGDQFTTKGNQFKQSIKYQFSKERIEAFIKKLYKDANNITKRQFLKTVDSRIGIDIAQILKDENLDDYVNAKVSETTDMITRYRDDIIGDYNTNTLREANKGRSLKELYSTIAQTKFKTSKRAKRIAREELKNFTTSLNKKRYKDNGITKVKWSTSGDERVRDCHKARNGKIYEIGKGLYSSCDGKTIEVGEEFGCRCVAIPILEF